MLSGVLMFISVIVITVIAHSHKTASDLNASQHQISHLKKQGKSFQLIVDDKPFLISGGELGNSTFTSVEYMEPIWPRLKALNIYAILAPVCRKLIEPAECWSNKIELYC